MSLSLAAMERILKDAGCTRVSEEAKEALREVLEAQGREIGQQAQELMSHAGRRTVKASDIYLAKK